MPSAKWQTFCICFSVLAGTGQLYYFPNAKKADKNQEMFSWPWFYVLCIVLLQNMHKRFDPHTDYIVHELEHAYMYDMELISVTVKHCPVDFTPSLTPFPYLCGLKNDIQTTLSLDATFLFLH